MHINDLRTAYDQYCKTGIGDDALLHQAMMLLEAEIAKLAEERKATAALRLHIEVLRQAALKVFDQPLEYPAAPIASTNTFAPSLDALLRRVNLRLP